MKRGGLIDYEIALILTKHGKAATLNALARMLSLTQSELKSILDEIIVEGSGSSASKCGLNPVMTIDRLAQEVR